MQCWRSEQFANKNYDYYFYLSIIFEFSRSLDFLIRKIKEREFQISTWASFLQSLKTKQSTLPVRNGCLWDFDLTKKKSEIIIFQIFLTKKKKLKIPFYGQTAPTYLLIQYCYKKYENSNVYYNDMIFSRLRESHSPKNILFLVVLKNSSTAIPRLNMIFVARKKSCYASIIKRKFIAW